MPGAVGLSIDHRPYTNYVYRRFSLTVLCVLVLFRVPSVFLERGASIHGFRDLRGFPALGFEDFFFGEEVTGSLGSLVV